MLPALGYVNRPRFAGGVGRLGLEGASAPGTAKTAGGATRGNTVTSATPPMIGFRGKGALSSNILPTGVLPVLPEKAGSKPSVSSSTERLDALEAWQEDVKSKGTALLDQRKHYDELQLEVTKAMCKIETLQTETNSLRQTLNATTQADRSSAVTSLSVVPVLQKKLQTVQEAVETLSKRLPPLEETVKKGFLASQEAFSQSLLLLAQTTQALQVKDSEGRVWSIPAHQPLLLRPPSTVVDGTLFMQTTLPCITEGNLEHLLCTVPVNQNGLATVTFQSKITKASLINNLPSYDTHVDVSATSAPKRQKT